MLRAVIDIGTNSVKLLVARVTGGTVTPLHEKSEQTRLGQDFYETHLLQADAISRTAQTVTRFRAEAQAHGVPEPRVLATSAARDATNQGDLLRAVRAASGLEVQVISGDEEADLAFVGVRSDQRLATNSLLILEVGGGSSQFVFGMGVHPDARWSFPLGSVRLLERIQPEDPPRPADWERCRDSVQTYLHAYVEPLVRPWLKAASPLALLVGTGGTSSIMAAIRLELTCFDRERIENTTLTANQIWDYQRRLWSMPLEQRRTVAGLPSNRADVILFGVAIFALVTEVFGFSAVRVSTRGLRFGAVLMS